MGEIFLKLLNRSIAAGWLIVAVVILRFCLQKAPKWVRCILWGIVAVRLICPFSIESVWSLIPSAETLTPYTVRFAAHPTVTSGISVLDRIMNPVMSDVFAPKGLTSVNPLYVWMYIAGIVWLIGLALMLAYMFVSYVRLKYKIREAVLLRENIWICDTVQSPFILGLLKPRIYLSSSMDETQMPYVLVHEQAHLRRKDQWWKWLGYLLLAVYWFHPLVWVSYVLFCRDLESACDESGIHRLDMAEKKAYVQVLLDCHMHRPEVMNCPLAFGEIGVKSRVKAVLNYKKSSRWMMLTAVMICIVAAGCFLTDPVRAEKGAWFKIGVNVQNLTNEDLNVYVVVKNADLRISSGN